MLVLVVVVVQTVCLSFYLFCDLVEAKRMKKMNDYLFLFVFDWERTMIVVVVGGGVVAVAGEAVVVMHPLDCFHCF